MSKKNDTLPFPEVGGEVRIPLVFKEEEVYTKATIHNKAAKRMNDILESGNANAIEIYAKLKALSEFISACMDNVKPEAIDEIAKYGDDECSIFGMKLVEKGTPKKYSFSHYDRHEELQDVVNEATKELKALEKTMKDAIGTEGFVDSDTGEVVAPAKITDQGKTTIQVTIPNK